MAMIYETENFILESHEKPEVDRFDGGHIKISPKIEMEDRSSLSSNLAIELMRFTIVSGEAMKKAMKKNGVDVGRINYQDNGNWKPKFHIHLYGRSKNAKFQKFGEPIVPGNKKEYRPLLEEDISRIRTEIFSLFMLKKFSDEEWGLK